MRVDGTHPGKVAGQPLVRGTRISAETIADDAEIGPSPDEIHKNFPDLTIGQIRRLMQF